MTENMNETWKKIPGLETYYEISNLRRIKRLAREVTTKSGTTRKYKEKIIYSGQGNDQIRLVFDGKTESYSLNSLLYQTFPELFEIENLPGEIWKDCVGYEGWYQVSNLGRVKSLPREISYQNGKKVFRIGKLIGQFLDRKDKEAGYLKANLCKEGFSKQEFVHRLVALAHVPNPHPDKFNIPNHLDEDKQNNKAENLEWTDTRGNILYSKERARLRNLQQNP